MKPENSEIKPENLPTNPETEANDNVELDMEEVEQVIAPGGARWFCDDSPSV